MSLIGCKASDLDPTGDESKETEEDSGQGYDSYHSKNKDGVYHGEDYKHPNSYCSSSSCHGSDLTGGNGPSCYSCHGVKWSDNYQDHRSYAPGHNLLYGGYFHAAGLHSPESSCALSGCHGLDLKGDLGPSCYLCHGERWGGALPGP
ncbi:MAG: hypothetical protein RRB13_00210 [bacterium]|nr:hypothetical protein [bacterium]